MQEDFLHYIWKYKKIGFNGLETVDGKPLEILDTGQHNYNSGPDFFNSKLKIDGQLWAGNVEIHIKSSDWFVHNHEQDKAYNNVILHVVWENDVEIFRSNNEVIPTLALEGFIPRDTLNNYSRLFSKSNKWINCENNFKDIDSFLLNNWLERLYLERLEAKSQSINKLLKESNNDWEAVLFKILAKNFGLKVNGEAFLSLANSFDFSVIRKLQFDAKSLESLLFGQADILHIDSQDSYYKELFKHFEFIRNKYNLSNAHILPIQFFRLRPSNFPTIRLSQLANLYSKEQNLFSKVIEAKFLEEFYALFSVSASNYWDSHYSFGATSKLNKKRLSKSFIDLLLINSVIPLKFSFAKYKGINIDDEILNLIQEIASEKNAIIDKFNDLKKVSHSALHSQALIHLKHNYCDKNKCLQCAIGNSLLNRK